MRKTEEKKIVKRLTKIKDRLTEAGCGEFEAWHINNETLRQMKAAKLIIEAIELLNINQKSETMYDQLGITIEKFKELTP